MFKRLFAWLGLVLAAAVLTACGGGTGDGKIHPLDASATGVVKECQMRLYGVAIWNEVRPRSNLEKKTYSLSLFDGYIKIGGESDGKKVIVPPEFVVLDLKSGQALLQIKWRDFWPGPPFASPKMRVSSNAFEGYRYGRIWSCMVEDLSVGDQVIIFASGDETVPAEVSIEAYWPLANWGNQTTIPAGYEYFAIPGDNVSLDFR